MMSAHLPPTASNHSCVPLDAKYGKYVNEIKEILAGLDGNQAMDTLK